MRIETKEDRRDRIKFRIRKRLRGTAEQPRLSVFRSGAHIYAQVIDDRAGATLAAASSVEPAVKSQLAEGARGGNRKGAEAVGRASAGEWTLGITDDFPNDDGTLLDWALELSFQ